MAKEESEMVETLLSEIQNAVREAHQCATRASAAASAGTPDYADKGQEESSRSPAEMPGPVWHARNAERAAGEAEALLERLRSRCDAAEAERGVTKMSQLLEAAKASAKHAEVLSRVCREGEESVGACEAHLGRAKDAVALAQARAFSQTGTRRVTRSASGSSGGSESVPTVEHVIEAAGAVQLARDAFKQVLTSRKPGHAQSMAQVAR